MSEAPSAAAAQPFNVNGFIEGIGTQQGEVSRLMNALSEENVSTEDMLKLSMELMVAQQKLTIMTDSFSKTMKANTDAQKAAVQNMH